MKLLKEMIHEIILEKLRSTGLKFKMNEFKALKTLGQQTRYAEQRLEKLGQGEARAVFLLSSSKVLKIARSSWTIDQNEHEIELAKNPLAQEFVTRIFDHDPQNRWIIAELARPATMNEFEAVFGVDLYTALQEINFEKDIQTPKLQKLADAVHAIHINTIELSVLQHWGVTASGRIVIVDYGI